MKPTAKSSSPFPAALVYLLRKAYLANVETLAARLRPRIESGEIAPWDGMDDRWEDRSLPDHGRHAPPNNRLWDVCQRCLARTWQDAHLVLALTAPDFDATANGDTVRFAAARAIAEDVLAVGEREGWYRPPATSRAA